MVVVLVVGACGDGGQSASDAGNPAPSCRQAFTAWAQHGCVLVQIGTTTPVPTETLIGWCEMSYDRTRAGHCRSVYDGYLRCIASAAPATHCECPLGELATVCS